MQRKNRVPTRVERVEDPELKEENERLISRLLFNKRLFEALDKGGFDEEFGVTKEQKEDLEEAEVKLKKLESKSNWLRNIVYELIHG